MERPPAAKDAPLKPGKDAFSVRVKEALEGAGFDQRQFAKKLNIGEGTVSNWVNSVAEPDLNDLIVIAKTTGQSIDWLLGYSDQKGPTPLAEGAVSSKAARRLRKQLAGARATLELAEKILGQQRTD